MILKLTREIKKGLLFQIQEKLTPYLRKCGFPEQDFSYMPCSGLTGAFLKERPSSDICNWYTGLCFLDYLDALPPIKRDFEGPTRAIVANKFSVIIFFIDDFLKF